MGGVKSGLFLNAGCIVYSISIFILHFTYLGGAYAPNAPPVHGSATAIPGYFNDQVDIELHCTTATDIRHQRTSAL